MSETNPAVTNPAELNERLAEAYERFRHRVFSYCLKCLGNWDDAEDVVQYVFLTATRKAHRLNWDGDMFPWLRFVAKNRCRNTLRGKRRSKNSPLTIDPADSDRPHEMAELNEELQLAMSSLLPEARRRIAMRFEHGMTHKQIAKHEGCVERTCRDWTLTTRRQLMEALRYRGVTPCVRPFASQGEVSHV